MKIDGHDPISSLFEVQQQSGEKDARNEQSRVNQGGGSREDRLELSTEVRDLVEQAKEASDPQRAERVAEIARQVESGTYNIRAERVADALITGSIISEDA